MAKKQAGLILTDSQMKQRYPSSGYASNICLPQDQELWLPSSILALNWQYGGGIPYGGILEAFGEESTGKSLLAANFASVCNALGGITLWNDAEATFDGRWYQRHGMDLSRTLLLPDENMIEVISDWQADMIVTWRNKLKNNEPILLVVDSTAALDTMANMSAADSDSGEDMGRRSKWIYQMVRKRNPLYAKYGVCVIYINQLRKKPVKTKFEDPDTTPGGNAMKFYASIRSGIVRGKRIENNKDIWVGQNVYFRTKKNKVSEPKRTVKGQVYFKEYNGNFGYSKYYDFENILDELGTAKRKRGGNWYVKNKLIARGDEKFITLFKEDEDLRKKLIRRSEVNTISQTRKKIESLTKNLYPVYAKKARKETNDSSTGEEA